MITLIEVIGGFSFLAAVITVTAATRALSGARRAAVGWMDRVTLGEFAHADRSDAIFEIDRAISGVPAFVFLRRLTGIAPLAGVIGTVILLAVAGGAESIGGVATETRDALEAIRPAFSGVLIGAVWAIINQLVVIWIESKTAGFRQDAISKVDPALIGTRYSVLGPFIRELEDFSRGIGGCQSILVTTQERLAAVATDTLKQCCESMDQLEASALTAANRLDVASKNHLEQMERSTANFTEAVDRMSKVVSDVDGRVTLYLQHAGTTSESAMEVVRESLDRTREAVRAVENGLQGCVHGLEARIAEQSQALRISAEQAIESQSNISAQTIDQVRRDIENLWPVRDGALLEAINRHGALLQQRMVAHGTVVEQVSIQTEAAIGRLTAGVESLSQAGGIFGRSADDLRVQSNETASVVDTVRHSVVSLNEVLTEIRNRNAEMGERFLESSSSLVTSSEVSVAATAEIALMLQATLRRSQRVADDQARLLDAVRDLLVRQMPEHRGSLSDAQVPPGRPTQPPTTGRTA